MQNTLEIRLNEQKYKSRKIMLQQSFKCSVLNNEFYLD